MYGLLLHSVDKAPRLSMSSYSCERFGSMLDEIKRRDIDTITVSQQTSSPKISTAITFDDGLQSFYDFAYPLLEDRGIKSTVFAVAGLIGKTGGWDIMGKTSHMTAGMLREVSDKGHEIGSHSLTHANLIWLDDGELMKELRDSKSMLEDTIGKPIKSVSFPFGSWNRRVWDAALSAGYRYATAYRGHSRISSITNGSADKGFVIIPVFGVYRFDRADDAVDRILPGISLSKILASAMSHFSKGTPIVKFRKEYRRFP